MGPTYVPQHNTVPTQPARTQVTTTKPVQSKIKVFQLHIQRMTHPPRIQTCVPKPPTPTSSELPPLPASIIQKSSPMTLPPPQKR